MISIPFYDYFCPACGEKEEIYKSVSKYSQVEYCKKCNEVLKRNPMDLASNYKTDCVGFCGKFS